MKKYEVIAKKMFPGHDKDKIGGQGSSIRFNITDSKGFDNSSISMLDELKNKGLGADE